jgi:flavorubredoxin
MADLKSIELTPGIYWVGGKDWNLRDFHGYKTQEGSTYNAYLIIDEKVVLIDSVKHYLWDEMYERISHVIDPKKIDIVVSNHVEMDHSGSIPKVLDLVPNAELICSINGAKGLKKTF